MTRVKICIVATVPFALNMYMKPHIAILAEQYDVTLISDGTVAEVEGLLGPHVRFIGVPIERKISLLKDWRSLMALYRIFRRERYSVVHTLMPKTALLGMLAAYLAGIPIRLHSFTGQVWANRSGVARFALKLADRWIAALASNVLADSFSQRDFLLAEGVLPAAKIAVLGNGSICGVDVTRFRADPERRSAVRRALGIPESAVVCLFVGRLNRDKGVDDLARAFASLAGNMDDLHLLVVGPDECNIQADLERILAPWPGRFHRVDYTPHPEHYMACADLFCLPSYREGFGSVVIEAAAVGIPTVASKIYGLSDAVVHGETGLLHPPKDVAALATALEMLVRDPQRRLAMGQRARARVDLHFTSAVLQQAMKGNYQALLSAKAGVAAGAQ